MQYHSMSYFTCFTCIIKPMNLKLTASCFAATGRDVAGGGGRGAAEGDEVLTAFNLPAVTSSATIIIIRNLT